jgi:lysophospholipase L1-like esterase
MRPRIKGRVVMKKLAVAWVRLVLLVSLFMLALPPVQGLAHPSKRADLLRLVVVGDSLSAGFQNGSLLDTQQVNGYAALIAAQAGVELPLPLIEEPGIPNVLTLLNPGPPPVIVQEPGISSGRVDPTIQTLNLAVPGANVQDALTTRPDLPIDSLTDLVLGLPGLLPEIFFGAPGISMSQVEWAKALFPTTILLWIGSNDALGAAVAADASLVTPVPVFEAAYEKVMARLAATGATLAVANIPDVTVIPFLTSAEDAAALIGAPLALIGPILGIDTGDFLTPDAFPMIEAILTGTMSPPLPGTVVLTAEEVQTIRSSIEAFNAIIAAQAAAKGAVLVDIHALLDAAKASGIVVGGQRLTTAFLDGLFSLDGVHPTNTGYTLIANEFIRALNTHFAAGIPPVSVHQIQQEDPLVLPGVGHPASALEHVSPEAAASLRAVMVPRGALR